MTGTTVTKAVLLAAGRGTRMGKLTNELPKPMIAVRGKPILQHIIEGLSAAGVRQFLIIVGWRAEVVRQRLGDGVGFGVTIQYATQVVQDGTGKVLELARQFAGGDSFLLSYGDIIVEPANYLRLTRLEAGTEALVTITRSEDVSKGGAVFVNERFELIDLREKPQAGEPTSPWYNAGIYVFRDSIFDFITRLERSPRAEFELTDAIRALAQSGRKVQTLELSGAWADVRDPEILARLNQTSPNEGKESSSG
jgi:UDP-N-acetylglucosamine diphosphorylase / glucose-1-phosphate thymidylyltransferase / UDP-N-acetylgalactosamine diphosphorylase / glucosamine-1-phosphate N-acetyltransferase / galactosamine-1-phosphate N-acetyltransferase